MTVIEKLKSIRAAVFNIWFGNYFVFDPGNPTTSKEKK